MMKTILITKDNVENFAEEMFKFNCNNTYNSLCFSCSDIKREQHALNCTDAIIEEMDKAGFDMTAIQAFKQHNWKVDDLVSPNKDNPVLYFTCNMYENYLDRKNINDYYTDVVPDNIADIDRIL